MYQPPILSEKQKQLIADLGQFLDFGYSQVSRIDPFKKMRPRKALLVTMLIAVQNYSEGIWCLLKEARTNTAEVILRSLIESTINLAYIYAGRSEENAVRFILDDEYDRKNLGKNIFYFLTKYPQVKTGMDDLRDPSYWKNFIRERDKTISKIKKAYPYQLNRIPNLRQRAVMVDIANQAKSTKPLKMRLEWWYITIYWYFSVISHLGSRGLNSFFNVDPKVNTIFVNVSGNVEDIDRIAVTTYTIYYQFLRLFIKKFKVIEFEQLKPYRDRIRQYVTPA